MSDPVSAPGSFVPSFPPLAAFGGSPLYITGEDALCATVLNAAAGVTVTISGRMLEFGATRPTPFSQTLVPATDRSASVVRFTLGDGWLLNAEAIVSSGTPSVGQTFARLSLCRGITTNAPDLFTLAADSITAKMPVSYPGSGVLRSTDGAGAIRSITGSTPAAGADISEVVPTGARWELLALMTALTCSATVANRKPRLTFDDGANVVASSANSQAVTATSGFNFSWAPGMNLDVNAPGDTFQQPIPIGLRLAAGFRIRTLTIGIQTADQWTAPKYLVREWIEGA